MIEPLALTMLIICGNEYLYYSSPFIWFWFRAMPDLVNVFSRVLLPSLFWKRLLRIFFM